MLKMKLKDLPVVVKPHSVIERTLTNEGFLAVHIDGRTDFVATFEDLSTRETYRVTVPSSTDAQGITKLKLHAAFFEEEAWIPRQTMEAVLSKLKEMSDYLQYAGHKRGRRRQNIVNTMAPNEKELIQLGNEMRTMKTNQQLVEMGLIPDPMQ